MAKYAPRRYFGGVGFFRRAMRRFEYERPRSQMAPPGWVTAEAVVDGYEEEATSVWVGSDDSNSKARVYDTRATYLVLGPDGAPLPIEIEDKLHTGDRPRLGKRLLVAYDPAQPSALVVLLDEQAYGDEQRARVRDAIERGSEAPCEVVSVRLTGRVARPAGSPETELTLRVEPSAAEPFEVSTALWDRGFGLAPGVQGTLIYSDDERQSGYPVFPDAQQRAAGADAVRRARDEFVQRLTGGVVQVRPGLTISSGGSTPLDI